jgi:hypothetical protein
MGMAKSTILRIFMGVLVAFAVAAIPLGLEMSGRITPTQADALVISGIVALVGAGILWWVSKRFKRIENYHAHVAKIITDDKAESLLILPTALQDLGELAIELADKLVKTGILEAKLTEIQRQLREDYKIKQFGMYEDVPEQTIRNGVKQTLKRLKISGVNKETIMFVLHVAGVLDDEGVGIMTQWQESDKYKLVAKLQPKVATQELNNAIYVYLCYCIGINSILLLVSYFPAKAIRKVNRTFKKTPAELREDRTRILNILLTDIRQLVEGELHRQG